MVAALQRLTNSVFGRGIWQERTTTARKEEVHLVGEYYADYGGLTAEEMAASDPEADALIERSRVVSVKRL